MDIRTAASDGQPGPEGVALSWRSARPLRALGQDEPEPWALPLVVRVERAEPPAHEQVLVAAALAVLALLSDSRLAPAADDTRDAADSAATADPRDAAYSSESSTTAETAATGPGPWRAPVEHWLDGRIRKLARRARATRWEALAELPGVTVALPRGEVRALLPHPVADPPPEVDRLQIGGLNLEDPTSAGTGWSPWFRLPAADPDATGEPHAHLASAEGAGEGLSIFVNPELDMTTGKSVAQVGHASQLALMLLPQSRVQAWARAGFPVRLRSTEATSFGDLVAAEDVMAGVVAVRDAGFTEVAPGSVTCVARLEPLEP